MRVVLDTNILISALYWKQEAFRLLTALVASQAQIFTSAALMEEFAGVLQRDFDEANEAIEAHITDVLAFANVVRPAFTLAVVIDDPDDDRVLECAVEAAADTVITYDKHLLALKEYNGIAIITPRQALSLLGK